MFSFVINVSLECNDRVISDFHYQVQEKRGNQLSFVEISNLNVKNSAISII